jgi:GrpB-like predicted nucleotidyltransferase (UPF0157 family)
MASRPDDAPTHLDAKLDAVLIGGREPVTIQVVDYDSGWPERFEAEQWRIATALGPLARRVEHIGSTAVPGLAAKPVVDMLVEVDDPDDEERYRPQMESAGFQLRVREPRHRMFRTPARDVHVHIWPTDSAEASAYLILLDWLRAHADDRELYAQVKRTLARRPWRDMNYYAEAKSAIIAQISASAGYPEVLER